MPETHDTLDRPAVRPVREAARRRAAAGVEGNARLTGLTAGILLVLLALEGVTLLALRPLLTWHVVLGMVLIPLVVLKIGSTGWRMARYYLGARAYRERGAPLLVLRLLGPVMIVLTVLVLASGVALLLAPTGWRNQLFFVHKASFVLWFGATTVHVLGHALETSRLAPADLVARTRRQVRGAGLRLWTVAVALVVGVVLAIVTVPTVAPWLAAGVGVHG